VVRAILTNLKEGTWQALPTKQRATKLKGLKQGEGVSRAMLEVSCELGLHTTGHLLPFICMSQEKGATVWLTSLCTLYTTKLDLTFVDDPYQPNRLCVMGRECNVAR
jgi:hypothetical protein